MESRMMKHMKHNKKYYVVQFIELPFEGIRNYICVPSFWLLIRGAMKVVFVAYPKDEDHFETRKRVRRKERCNITWGYYKAVIKHETDTYKDAINWINDYGPLGEEKSKIRDTQPTVTLDKKLCSANQTHLSKSNDNSGQPLPIKSIKPPAMSEPRKQDDRKQMNLDEAAQSSSAVVENAKAELIYLTKEQSDIILNNQSMECTQTKETAVASNGDESIEQRTQTQPTKQNKQALSLPIIVTDEHTDAINISDKDHLQCFKNADENNCFPNYFASENDTTIIQTEPSTSAEQTTQPNQYNNQEHILDSGSSSWKFQPQIENVQSFAKVHNDHEPRVNKVSISKLSTSHKIPNSLKRSAKSGHINGARLIYQRRLHKKRRLAQMQRSSLTPLVKQLSAVTRNQSQNERRPKKRIGISVKPKNNRQIHRGNIQKTPQLNTTKVLNSLREYLLTTHNTYLHNEHQLQASQSRSVQVQTSPESHLNAMDKACQTDVCMVEETLTLYNAVTSDLDAVADHKVILDHEMSADETPVKIANNAHCSGIASSSNIADRPTASQNLTSTNHQMDPRVVLEEQMLDNFAFLFTQMGSTLRYTCDMYKNLRSSILQSTGQSQSG